MVMRKLAVPHTKRFYILHDAKREASKYDIDFGFIADPLGKGVERCYALFSYAQQEGKPFEYLINYSKAVWAEGIRSDTDQGLKKIIEHTGLDWQHAKTLLNDDSWRVWAKANLDEMYQYNMWGVPSFRYNKLVMFGQDRLDNIIEAITQKPR